jgi:uncharacterized membrane protein YgcG
MKALTRLAAMLSGGRVMLLALVAAAVLAGCGGDEGTIPSESSDKLLERLTEIEEAVPEGDCDGAQNSADLFVDQVDQLPAEVDDEVKRLLTAGGERLQELAAEQCEEPPATGASGEEGFQPEEPTTTPETTADTTTDTTTDTTEEQPPPDDEGDDDGGNGNTGDQGGGNTGGGNQGGGNQSGGTGSGGIGGGGD